MRSLMRWEGWCAAEANATTAHAPPAAAVVESGAVLGSCFQDLVVYSGAALIVAVAALATLVIVRKRAHRYNKQIPKPLCVWRGAWLRNVELLACVACVAMPIVQVVALNLQHAAWILFTALNAVAWLLYASVLEQYPDAQLRARLAHAASSSRGVQRAPISMRLTGLLLTGAGAYRLWTILAQAHPQLTSAHTIGELAQIGTFFLHTLIMLVSLCVPMRACFLRPPVRVRRTGVSIQDDDGAFHTAHEATPLLSTSGSAAWQRDDLFKYNSVNRLTSNARAKPQETSASVFSKLVFQWVDPLLHFGYLCDKLQSEDLFGMPDHLNTQALCDAFSSHVFALRQSHSDKHFVLRAFNRCYGWRYYPLAVLKVLADAAGFAGPLLLHELVQLIDEESPDYSKGYMYAGLLVLCTAFGSFCNIHYTFQVNKTQVAVRAAVTSTVYRKALRSRVGEKRKDAGADSDGKDEKDEETREKTKKTKKQDEQQRSLSTVGGVMNLMSTDADRLANFCPSFHQFWSLPFQIAVSLYLLYQQVGVSFLAGLCFALVMIPLNRAVAKRIGALGKDLMHNKDERVKLTGEVVSAIRVVRMYAWAHLFEEKINTIRERELKALRGRKYLDAVCVYLWATTPVLISISTFATYSLLGHRLTAATVFTSMALFNTLIGPLNAFPWVLNGLVEAWVSLDRVESYLRLRYTFGSVQKAAAHAANWAPDTPSTPSPAATGTVTATAAAAAATTTRRAARPASLSSSASSSSALAVRQSPATPNAAAGVAVSLHDAYFSWQDQARNKLHASNGGTSASAGSAAYFCVLRGVSFDLRQTEWVCLTGAVGSGKTMLLLGMLGELAPTRGQVLVSSAVQERGIGYVPQEPWIRNATIRDNILCGRPMHRHLYDRILHACALEDDLQFIKGGDGAELGENGINLSGGQRARIGLARAAYQQLPLYLLDSPLAALDRPTARHVLQHCICGVMAASARVLCTENRDALASAPRVVRVEDGHLADATAEYQQQQQHDDGHHGNVHGDGDGDDDDGRADGDDDDNNDDDHTGADGDDDDNDYDDGEGPPMAEVRGALQRSSRKGRARGSTSSSPQQQDEGQLLAEEDRVVGTVRLAVYASYVRAIGGVLAAGVLVAMTLMQGSKNVSDWWLSNWVTHADRNSSSDARQYLEIYGFISLGNTAFTLVRAFLFAYAGVVAARTIHRRLLHRVFGAHISFFDRNPVGRIVNRFSSDINSVDDSLPFIANILLAQLFGLLGTVAVMCYSQPYFLFLLLPLSVLYYRIQRYYRKTSREVKRLGNIARSPIYAHFSESLTGVVSVRAMHMVRQFELENVSRMDANQIASYNEQVVSQWLSVRLQVLGVGMLAGVSFLAAAQHHSGGANPGLAGLAISYALSVTGVLQGLVTAFTETEKEMVCVERCDAFIHTPQEEEDDDDDDDTEQGGDDHRKALLPQARGSGGTGNSSSSSSGHRKLLVALPDSWPQRGCIEFSHVSVRYRRDHAMALQDFSLRVGGGEKVGICGRTGSGKSTLFRALLRMVAYSGRISMDGVDIAHVGRQRLRESIAVIPQDPVMFSGTIRSNLDPFGQHADATLLGVLDKCCLARRVGSLDDEVEEQGRNMSAGERQLLCLARALLRGCRVLCIDEATANVDAHTDELVQQTIRDNFTACTVLTIAHRTNTLQHCHRVIELDHGRLARIVQQQQ